MARQRNACGEDGVEGPSTYKTPMLMAIITPTFSFRFMVKVQMIFQGKMAKTMSMAPE